jgi:hypothetical protein
MIEKRSYQLVLSTSNRRQINGGMDTVTLIHEKNTLLYDQIKMQKLKFPGKDKRSCRLRVSDMAILY